MQYVVENADDDLNIYNLGTKTTTSVTEIADIISDELGADPEYAYTGGDRGWTGDVPKMRLSIQKLCCSRLGARYVEPRGGPPRSTRPDRRDRRVTRSPSDPFRRKSRLLGAGSAPKSDPLQNACLEKFSKQANYPR